MRGTHEGNLHKYRSMGYIREVLRCKKGESELGRYKNTEGEGKKIWSYEKSCHVDNDSINLVGSFCVTF